MDASYGLLLILVGALLIYAFAGLVALLGVILIVCGVFILLRPLFRQV